MQFSKNNAAKNGTTALRAVINKKRQLGQSIEPLVLARLGAQYCRQNRDIKNHDEASFAVFERYLEIMPEDEQVRVAKSQLAPLRDTRQKKLRWRSIRLLVIGSSLATAAAIAGVFEHYTAFTPGLQMPEVVVAPEMRAAAVALPTAALEPSIASVVPPTASVVPPTVSVTPFAAVLEPPIAEEPTTVDEVEKIQIDKTPIVIRAVGDIVLGNNYPGKRLPDKDEMARITALQKTLGNADIVLGNLEAVLLD
ncbi:MAG: hypothetical protein GY896_09465, partial [Gammaproteobacteria bacterium]|nr:hypothetical protein [Gammaproteobacteria bacterium]